MVHCFESKSFNMEITFMTSLGVCFEQTEASGVVHLRAVQGWTTSYIANTDVSQALQWLCDMMPSFLVDHLCMP